MVASKESGLKYNLSGINEGTGLSNSSSGSFNVMNVCDKTFGSFGLTVFGTSEPIDIDFTISYNIVYDGKQTFKCNGSFSYINQVDPTLSGIVNINTSEYWATGTPIVENTSYLSGFYMNGVSVFSESGINNGPFLLKTLNNLNTSLINNKASYSSTNQKHKTKTVESSVYANKNRSEAIKTVSLNIIDLLTDPGDTVFYDQTSERDSANVLQSSSFSTNYNAPSLGFPEKGNLISGSNKRLYYSLDYIETSLRDLIHNKTIGPFRTTEPNIHKIS